MITWTHHHVALIAYLLTHLRQHTHLEKNLIHARITLNFFLFRTYHLVVLRMILNQKQSLLLLYLLPCIQVCCCKAAWLLVGDGAVDLLLLPILNMRPSELLNE